MDLCWEKSILMSVQVGIDSLDLVLNLLAQLYGAVYTMIVSAFSHCGLLSTLTQLDGRHTLRE